ncbi:MAG: TonB-dependent receptor [Bacteroidia bacterium]|nr:TonB-dependent receptor [Bacteroidia bacterium]
MRRVRLIAGICALLTGSTLHAQFDLDTVAIATSRADQTAGESGRHITVLSAEALQRLPAASVDEAIRYLSGAEVQSRGAFGTQSDFSIRGSTFSQVLVLLDGMRLNDPLTGHFSSNIPVTLSEIARIEVLRGPAAAQFGPDAVGGVIHIVTWAALEGSGTDTREADAQLMGGPYGLLLSQAGGRAAAGRLRVSGGVMWNRAAGQPLPPDSTDVRNDFSLRTASVSAGYRIGQRWYGFARTGWDLRTFNAQYFYTRSAADFAREETGAWWNHLSVRRTGAASRTVLDLGYKVNTDSFLFNPNTPPNLHTTRFLNLQAFHLHRVSEQLQLSGGLQADLRTIVSTDRGDHQARHAGAFATAYWEPAEGLHLTGSLRADADDNYGLEWLPQLSVSYQRARLGLRAVAGRGIRAADFTERFVSARLPAPLAAGRNLGNPFLEAERSWTYEAGADLRPAEGVRLSMTAFYRRGRNLIDFVTTPASEIPNNANLRPDASYFYARNVAVLNTAGAEAELSVQRQLSRQVGVQGSAGYLFLNTENPAGVISKYISNHARHLLTLHNAWQIGRATLAISGLYKVRLGDAAPGIGAELAPSYTVWHLRAGYWALRDRAAVNVQVHNLFDAVYADFLGAQMPRRWIAGGVQVRLRSR